MTTHTPQREDVTIRQYGEQTATCRMLRSGDWAVAQTRWGATVTHVPTGRTIGHYYPHQPDAWPALLRRLNAAGAIPESIGMHDEAYRAWASKVKAALEDGGAA